MCRSCDRDQGLISDKVSLRENAKNNTVFAIFGGIGYEIGPIIGGYLAQASWRCCFIINIPIGVIGLVLVHFLLRSELFGPQPITRSDGVFESQETPLAFTAKMATIDFGGQFLFLFGMGLLVLALTWAGSSYSWADVNVIAPLVIGCLLIAGFLVWEYFMAPESKLAVKYPYRKAMIPLKLLFTRNAGLLIYINFITGMGMLIIPSLSLLFNPKLEQCTRFSISLIFTSRWSWITHQAKQAGICSITCLEFEVGNLSYLPLYR
jgi:hypothetical protein